MFVCVSVLYTKEIRKKGETYIILFSPCINFEGCVNERVMNSHLLYP